MQQVTDPGSAGEPGCSLFLSMHIIIYIYIYMCGCACIHALICKFLQDKQKSQLCFLLEGMGEHQTNPTSASSIRQVLTVPCVPPGFLTHPIPLYAHRSWSPQPTAQIASQQQEKCFLSAGIQPGCEENSILRHF